MLPCQHMLIAISSATELDCVPCDLPSSSSSWSGAKKLEDAHDCLAAVAPAASAGSWAVLTATQGVQEYGRSAAALEPEPMASDDEDTGMTPEQLSPAMQTAMLLDSSTVEPILPLRSTAL